jgi:hypothetical protein
LLLNRWAREGELPPSPAPHPQKQNLAVYTKELTHLFDSADIVRDGMLQQLSEVSADSGKLHAGWLQRRASLSIVEPCCPVASHDAEGTRRYSEAHKRIVDVI